MRNRKWLHVAFGVVLLGLLSTASTGAITPNRRTNFTFSGAVRIPGAVLPAGTYSFELASENNLDLVRVLSKDRKTVYLTAFTVLVERQAKRNLDTKLVLGETPAGTPPPIKVWYPQDELTGRQFIY
jgi:hypothetical protein